MGNRALGFARVRSWAAVRQRPSLGALRFISLPAVGFLSLPAFGFVPSLALGFGVGKVHSSGVLSVLMKASCGSASSGLVVGETLPDALSRPRIAHLNYHPGGKIP
jgi:hypothetical protein